MKKIIRIILSGVFFVSLTNIAGAEDHKLELTIPDDFSVTAQKWVVRKRLQVEQVLLESLVDIFDNSFALADFNHQFPDLEIPMITDMTGIPLSSNVGSFGLMSVELALGLPLIYAGGNITKGMIVRFLRENPRVQQMIDAKEVEVKLKAEIKEMEERAKYRPQIKEELNVQKADAEKAVLDKRTEVSQLEDQLNKETDPAKKRSISGKLGAAKKGLKSVEDDLKQITNRIASHESLTDQEGSKLISKRAELAEHEVKMADMKKKYPSKLRQTSKVYFRGTLKYLVVAGTWVGMLTTVDSMVTAMYFPEAFELQIGLIENRLSTLESYLEEYQ